MLTKLRFRRLGPRFVPNLRAPLREALSVPPSAGAALIQLAATASAIAQAIWLEQLTGAAMTALQWALLQGATASLLALLFHAAAWWRVIHFLFAPALVLGVAAELPPQWCLAALLALAGVFWNSYRAQVPLYLSGKAAWREVARLLPSTGGVRVIDLGCGLGGLVAYLARMRPDARVDGVESAPLPFLASCVRAWISGREGGGGSASILWRDLWQVNLADYDVAHAYLSPVPMPLLWAKACREMRSGSLFLSHSFAVPGAEPLLVRPLPRRGCLYVYRIGG